MLTVKVVTDWAGSQTPPFNGNIKPSEHIFECESVYVDAGDVICNGVPSVPSDSQKSGSITYQSILYDQPWRLTLYVMNENGATVGKYLLGSFGGDIGCESKIAPNPWRQREAQPLAS